MPIHKGVDNIGYYFQYGTTGKRYYFNTELGRKRAYNKALNQTRAIKISEGRRRR